MQFALTEEEIERILALTANDGKTVKQVEPLNEQNFSDPKSLREFAALIGLKGFGQ